MTIPPSPACYACIIWSLIFAGYGAGVPYVSTKLKAIQIALLVIATLIFTTSEGNVISRIVMTEMLYFYTKDWDDIVGSDWMSYLCIAMALSYVWLW